MGKRIRADWGRGLLGKEREGLRGKDGRELQRKMGLCGMGVWTGDLEEIPLHLPSSLFVPFASCLGGLAVRRQFTALLSPAGIGFLRLTPQTPLFLCDYRTSVSQWPSALC